MEELRIPIDDHRIGDIFERFLFRFLDAGAAEASDEAVFIKSEITGSQEVRVVSFSSVDMARSFLGGWRGAMEQLSPNLGGAAH